MLKRFFQVLVLLTQPTGKFNLVRQQTCRLSVETIPCKKKFPGTLTWFSEKCAPVGLALISDSTIILILIIVFYDLQDTTGSNTQVEWNSCLDCERVIPRSPVTALVGCEHHEIGAVQCVLLEHHPTPKESQWLGQIVSWRCKLSISNTPVRWKWKTETTNCAMTCCIYKILATLRLKFNYADAFAFRPSFLQSRIHENFEDDSGYSLHSCPQPHTEHLPDCLDLTHTILRQVWQNHTKPLHYNF